MGDVDRLDVDGLPAHVRANRDHWDGAAPGYASDGEREWASELARR